MRTATEFAHFIKGLGFRVWLDKGSRYGFISDDTGKRVLTFGDSGNLGGNYGPPSRESGTGWQLEQTVTDLRTKADIERALYAAAPNWTRPARMACSACGAPRPDNGGGWKHYTTIDQHLAFYGSSSGYREI